MSFNFFAPNQNAEEDIDQQEEMVSRYAQQIGPQQEMTTPIPDDVPGMSPRIEEEMNQAQEIETELADVLARQPDNAGGMTQLSQDYLSMDDSVLKPQAPVVVPPAPSKLDTYRSLLAKAQKDRQDNLLTANLLSAGSKIAQGFATGKGAKIDANEDAVQRLTSQAGLPVEELREQQKNELDSMNIQNESEMNDPESDISKFMRQQAMGLASRMKLNPESIASLEKMTANQLQKIPMFRNMLGGANQGFTTLQGFVTKSGLPVMRDNITGQLLDAAGKPVNVAEDGLQYLYDKMLTGTTGEQFAYNPLTGPRSLSTESGPLKGMPGSASTGTPKIKTFEDKVQVLDSMYEKEGLDAFPNLKAPKVREAIQKEQQELVPLTKIYSEQNVATNKLKETLKKDNKLTGAVVKTQMPRLAGEVGNLNQSEQEVWQGSQAILDRILQFVETNISSTLTSENKKEIMELLAIYEKTAKTAYDNILDRRSKSLSVTYDVPSKYFKELYGTPFQEKKSSFVPKSGLTPEERQKRIQELKAKQGK